MHNPSKCAALSRGDLRLFINAPGAGSAGKAGGDPQPGGWSRFQIETEDLDGMIARLRKAGASFRGEMAEAGAGRQILLEDPSGNIVELFEYAERRSEEHTSELQSLMRISYAVFCLKKKKECTQSNYSRQNTAYYITY